MPEDGCDEVIKKPEEISKFRTANSELRIRAAVLQRDGGKAGGPLTMADHFDFLRRNPVRWFSAD
jgi:hypothetical protein